MPGKIAPAVSADPITVSGSVTLVPGSLLPAVPEPATLLLFLSGVVGVGIMRTRRRHKEV